MAIAAFDSGGKTGRSACPGKAGAGILKESGDGVRKEQIQAGKPPIPENPGQFFLFAGGEGCFQKGRHEL